MYLRQNATYRRLSDHFGGRRLAKTAAAGGFSRRLAEEEEEHEEEEYSALGHSPSTPAALTSHDFCDWTRIGRGGFGKVYRATPLVPHYPRSVAIKVVDKRTLKTTAAEQRLACEVAIHESMDHPSVVRVLDSFEDERFVYLVMELCAHGDLWKYLRQRRQLQGSAGGSNGSAELAAVDEAEARYVMRGVCAATAYVHARGALHRDLKLANLLLTEDMHVRVGDFGLATWTQGGGGGEPLTLCGTPSYISPEILARQPYGAAADVWALGCLLVTLLTGTPPFAGTGREITERQVAEIRLPRDVSRETKDLVRSMLRVDPRRRVRSEELLQHAFFAPAMPERRLRTLEQMRREGEQMRRGILAQRAEAGGVAPRERIDALRRPRVAAPQAHGPSPPPSSHPAHTAASGSLGGAASSAATASSLATFTTARLPPLKRALKDGKVHVRGDGLLVLDLAWHPLLVALDEHRPAIYEHRRPLRLAALDARTAQAAYAWDLQALPAGLAKAVRLGVRVAQHLQAQQKRLHFATPQARASLYSDLPQPLVRLRFFNGIRVDVARGRAEMLVEIPVAQDLPNEMHKIPLVPGDFGPACTLESRVPAKIRRILEHCREALARADAFDALLRQYEPGGRLRAEYAGELAYPVEMQWAWGDAEDPDFVPPGLTRRPSAEPSGHVAAMLTTQSTVAASTTLGAPARGPRPLAAAQWAGRGMDRRALDDTPTRRLNLGPLTRLVEEFSQEALASSPRAAPPVRPAQPLAMHSLEKPKAVAGDALQGAGFIRDVGWCVAVDGDGGLLMLFHDGCRLLIDVDRQTASYTDQAAEYAGLPLDHALPVRVKERLSWLPHFLLQMGQ
ncbi:hypothetical protein GGI15_003812 [Coemansia interrupta]|uniref:Protein kinase domain-containing protein n=1 Tax=Coemansia interrupta TaxID=1126814 RepID=A0A9W8H7Q3_9FUNG|nr:hypothetical protein GGI15_003812 [Coemansia interrupta]